MNTTITLTFFTPGEVERITGVTTAQQRDWRRREFLPSNEGQARFDAFAVAELLILKLLSDRGIGPQQSKEVADWCANGIVWYALGVLDAYEGDILRDFDSLRRQTFRHAGKPLVIPARYFIWWPDGTHIWHNSVDNAINDKFLNNIGIVGPIVVLDLLLLGQTSVKRASRPLVHIEMTETPS